MKFSDFQKLSEGFGTSMPPEHQKSIINFVEKLEKMSKESFGYNDDFPEDSVQIYVEFLLKKVSKRVLNPVGQDIKYKFYKK